jgi:hypothetical protein
MIIHALSAKKILFKDFKEAFYAFTAGTGACILFLAAA